MKKKGEKKPETINAEEVIAHLQVIHTWTVVDLEHGFTFGKQCLKNTLEWTSDALNLLKEQEKKIKRAEDMLRALFNRCRTICSGDGELCPFCMMRKECDALSADTGKPTTTTD